MDTPRLRRQRSSVQTLSIKELLEVRGVMLWHLFKFQIEKGTCLDSKTLVLPLPDPTTSLLADPLCGRLCLLPFLVRELATASQHRKLDTF